MNPKKILKRSLHSRMTAIGLRWCSAAMSLAPGLYNIKVGTDDGMATGVARTQIRVLQETL